LQFDPARRAGCTGERDIVMASKASAASTVSLAPVLDLNEATALHGKLMALRGKNVAVDASVVERMGAQCVQVLVAAAKFWEQEKYSFKIQSPSGAFTKTLQLIGISIDALQTKEI
jgi:chemotaxis protein CheX